MGVAVHVGHGHALDAFRHEVAAGGRVEVGSNVEKGRLRNGRRVVDVKNVQGSASAVGHEDLLRVDIVGDVLSGVGVPLANGVVANPAQLPDVRIVDAAELGALLRVLNDVAGGHVSLTGAARFLRDVRAGRGARAGPIVLTLGTLLDDVHRKAAGQRRGSSNERTANRRIVGVDEHQGLGAIVQVVVVRAVRRGILRSGLPVTHVEEVLVHRRRRVAHVVGDDTAGALETGEGEDGAVRHDAGGHALRLRALGVGAVIEGRRGLVGVEGAVRAVGRGRRREAKRTEVGIGDLLLATSDHLHLVAGVPDHRERVRGAIPRPDGDGAATDGVGATVGVGIERDVRRGAVLRGSVGLGSPQRLSVARLRAARFLRHV
mmetsp:Transcript_40990/g.128506  ORF Transcript_40990/g.128506 Transcript_40990/m.128506 type:complete len:375 (+) Transcript_40990:1709-2833(+)